MIPKSHLISLSAVPGMEPRRIRALLRKYPELDDVATLSKSDMIQVERISGELATNTKRINLTLEKGLWQQQNPWVHGISSIGILNILNF